MPIKQAQAVNQAQADTTVEPGTSEQAHERNVHFHGVRYQVRNVSQSVEFYSTHLGFRVRHQQLPAFAALSLGPLDLLLSGPGASGSRPMADGTAQTSGGWNRVVLRVSDLPGWIEKLRTAGVPFRNAMETGPGGRQVQIEDPDGNAIELFEPARNPG